MLDGDRERLRIPHVWSVPALRDPVDEALNPDMAEAARQATPARVRVTDDFIAVLDGQRLALFDSDGGLRWDIHVPLVQDIEWMGDTLVGEFSGGLARIELGSGRVVGATCGWSFGLSDTAPLAFVEGDSICEAP
jgi:hypothetical protein